ncbi:hypothetical protein R1flu_012368 [Riccia fluitans]|uniref:Uncharacterized protein n=1 Tax=Riccia fluitans TaxID=41844 RepID=A0ABD1ZAE7_9MARC
MSRNSPQLEYKMIEPRLQPPMKRLPAEESLPEGTLEEIHLRSMRNCLQASLGNPSELMQCRKFWLSGEDCMPWASKFTVYILSSVPENAKRPDFAFLPLDQIFFEGLKCWPRLFSVELLSGVNELVDPSSDSAPRRWHLRILLHSSCAMNLEAGVDFASSSLCLNALRVDGSVVLQQFLHQYLPPTWIAEVGNGLAIFPWVSGCACQRSSYLVKRRSLF